MPVFASRLNTVTRAAPTADVRAAESSPNEQMLRCQTCGSRNAMWEWCTHCANPNPFAWFKRLRLVAVLIVCGFAVLLVFLAHQRTQTLALSAHEPASRTASDLHLARRSGF